MYWEIEDAAEHAYGKLLTACYTSIKQSAPSSRSARAPRQIV